MHSVASPLKWEGNVGWRGGGRLECVVVQPPPARVLLVVRACNLTLSCSSPFPSVQPLPPSLLIHGPVLSSSLSLSDFVYLPTPILFFSSICPVLVPLVSVLPALLWLHVCSRPPILLSWSLFSCSCLSCLLFYPYSLSSPTSLFTFLSDALLIFSCVFFSVPVSPFLSSRSLPVSLLLFWSPGSLSLLLLVLPPCTT